MVQGGTRTVASSTYSYILVRSGMYLSLLLNQVMFSCLIHCCNSALQKALFSRLMQAQACSNQVGSATRRQLFLAAAAFGAALGEARRLRRFFGGPRCSFRRSGPARWRRGRFLMSFFGGKVGVGVG